MKKDANSPETTSRRQFTKAIVTAAVAAPIVASVACKTEPSAQPNPVGQNSSSPAARAGSEVTVGMREECFPSGGGLLEHIPPMGVDGGGGSLLIETTAKLKKGAGSTYEDDVAPDAEDKLGDIKIVHVITEQAKHPYLTIVRYSTLPTECRLLLWYQFLKRDAGTDDCDYVASTFPGSADVEIWGGNKTAGHAMKMTFREDLKSKEKTYKCKHPHRYRQADKGGNEGHFRVGQWQIVDKDRKILFSDNVNSANIPEHFRFYVTFDHYNPHP